MVRYTKHGLRVTVELARNVRTTATMVHTGNAVPSLESYVAREEDRPSGVQARVESRDSESFEASELPLDFIEFLRQRMSNTSRESATATLGSMLTGYQPRQRYEISVLGTERSDAA